MTGRSAAPALLLLLAALPAQSATVTGQPVEGVTVTLQQQTA